MGHPWTPHQFRQSAVVVEGTSATFLSKWHLLPLFFYLLTFFHWNSNKNVDRNRQISLRGGLKTPQSPIEVELHPEAGSSELHYISDPLTSSKATSIAHLLSWTLALHCYASDLMALQGKPKLTLISSLSKTWLVLKQRVWVISYEGRRRKGNSITVTIKITITQDRAGNPNPPQ